MAIGQCDGKAYHLTVSRGRYGVNSDHFHSTRIPQCDNGGNCVRHYVGGDFWIHAAPGFEYCLDAPQYSPAGAHACWPATYDHD